MIVLQPNSSDFGRYVENVFAVSSNRLYQHTHTHEHISTSKLFAVFDATFPKVNLKSIKGTI